MEENLTDLQHWTTTDFTFDHPPPPLPSTNTPVSFPTLLADYTSGIFLSNSFLHPLIHLYSSSFIFIIFYIHLKGALLKQEYDVEENFVQQFEQEFEKELEREFGSKKRKSNQEEKEGSDEDEDSTLAEKRRRNTAASARFRLKKKMKEQRLEAMAKLMTERANSLQKRVEELESEVTYLKDLITLRRDQKITDHVQI